MTTHTLDVGAVTYVQTVDILFKKSIFIFSTHARILDCQLMYLYKSILQGHYWYGGAMTYVQMVIILS
jgi:hypothetical protein